MQIPPETCPRCTLPYFHYAAHQSFKPFLRYLPVNFSYFSKDLGVDCELTVIKVSCTNNSGGKAERSHNFNVFQDFCCLAFFIFGIMKFHDPFLFFKCPCLIRGLLL